MIIVKRNILVVDDDSSILRAFKNILQNDDYVIDTADTGKEAMMKMVNRQYDLVLFDLRLSDMTGIDLLVKAKKQIANSVKIMITGFPSLETGVKSLLEGADGYLVKPVKGEELLSIVKDKLASSFLPKNAFSTDFSYE
jgi:DNA-binding response OmpR family regulator